MSFQDGLEGDCGRDRCHCAVFIVISRRSTQEFFFQEIFLLRNSESQMANCTIVDIVKYLYYYWQTLNNSFFIYISFH